MSTETEQSKGEHIKGHSQAAPSGVPARAPLLVTPHIAPAIAITAATPGVNPQDFFRDNRIMVKDGALFIDPYLAIHPRELDPKNEATLRRKLQLTYSINNPSFYETPERVATALNLGQLLPVSPAAKRSKLIDEVKKFNAEVESGKDVDLIKNEQDKRSPFSAIVRDTMKNPDVDPVGLELLKNGLAMYLLCREKLTKNGYLKPMGDYITRHATPDQVLSDLADKIGASPLQMREAALSGGVDGVGKLLGLDAHYIADVKALSEHAATQDFGYNVVEHWHLGRQVAGPNAPLAQKLHVGMEERINRNINEYRAQVRHHYDVPTPIIKEEQRIAQALELVDPIQRVMLHRLGYEICYSPEMTADDIAFYKGIYGLHRKAANNIRDVNGTYRIYFSGRGDLKGSMRTLVHETAHNLWPDQFTPQQAAEVDALARSDQQRYDQLQQLMSDQFPQFEKLLNAYHAGDANEKAAVIAAANQQFAPYGITVDGLFPHLKEAHQFQFMVKHAVDTLSVEGDRYNRSGYDGPEERFREVISRYAELRQVEHRAEPELLNYLAPGMNQIWTHYYIPHLEHVYAQIGPEQPHVPLVNPPAPVVPEPAPLPEPVVAQEQPKVEQRPADVKPAPVAPVAAEGTTSNGEQQPKVEQRPGEPAPATPKPAAPTSATTIESPRVKEQTTTHGSGHACKGDCGGTCAVHSASPSTSVETDGLEHNARTMAAVGALRSMGVDPSFR